MVASVYNTHILVRFSISWIITTFGFTFHFFFPIGREKFHFKASAHLTKNHLYPSVCFMGLDSPPVWKDLVTLGPNLRGLLPCISGLPGLSLSSFSICCSSLVAVFPGKSCLWRRLTRRYRCSLPVVPGSWCATVFHPFSPLSWVSGSGDGRHLRGQASCPGVSVPKSECLF